MSNISFREELMLKAEEYEKSFDIQKDIETIKGNLNAYYYKREFTVSLVEVTKGPITIGQHTPGRISLFIPQGAEPLRYRQSFINTFNKLGFTEECMEFWEREYKDYYEYNITLKW